MKNQNIADISAFESIQTNGQTQNTTNSMAIFNDIADAKKAAERVTKIAQQEINIQTEADNAIQALTDVLRKEHKRIYEIQDNAEREKEKQQLKSIIATMKTPKIYDKSLFIKGIETIR
ncbi:MAG: hypothetical protein LBP59_10590 [Planctomycetaceae bacterium]|jgi:hypothetical protein|nr:hypothetical protein [Planctomycetaceae bacterium]